MNTITIICSVAAEFVTADEKQKYVVNASQRNLILQAPAWIEETREFELLAADGSLKAVTSANRVQLENDPTIGQDPDGKASEPVRRGRKKAEEA